MNAEHAKSDARSGPLAGIRVLDLGVMVSSPFATRAMADLGAEIIKVEAFEGDPQRAGGGLKPGANPTAIFASVQRNRLGIAVDLKKPEGARVVRDLARRSDVVVANFRPGVAARLGVDYESLSADNPRLVYCSITGFGEDGPLSNVPVTDGVIQAFAGVLELTGTGGTFGHPFKVVIADQIAGATACQAILGALVGRQVDGRGRKIDISMLDCMLSWLHTATRFDVAGPSSTTFLLEASDGRHVLVQCPLHFEERFIGLIVGQPGFEHLASDERFTSRKKRAENRQQYVEAVQGAFKSMTAAQWLEKLATASIPAAEAHRVAEALNHPVVSGRGCLAEMRVNDALSFTMVRSPFVIDGVRCGEVGPPPWVGQHTDQVLASVAGYTRQEIDGLRQREVVR